MDFRTARRYLAPSKRQREVQRLDLKSVAPRGSPILANVVPYAASDKPGGAGSLYFFCATDERDAALAREALVQDESDDDDGALA